MLVFFVLVFTVFWCVSGVGVWCGWCFVWFLMLLFAFLAALGVCWFGFSLCRSFGKLVGNCQKLLKFRKIQTFSETELVEVLLGRASFGTHPKAVLAMDYT